MLKLSLKNTIAFILLIFLIIGTLMLFYNPNRLHKNKCKTLSFSLGEDIRETQVQSTYDFHVDKHDLQQERDMFAITVDPTIVKYRDPVLGFELPPTMIATIMTKKAKVRDVVTYPQLVLLNLHESQILLKKLIDTFDRLGWSSNPQYGIINPDSLQSEQFENRHNYEIVVGAWLNDNKELMLSIKRRIKKEELGVDPTFSYYAKKPYYDYYLIEVSLTDLSIKG